MGGLRATLGVGLLVLGWLLLGLPATSVSAQTGTSGPPAVASPATVASPAATSASDAPGTIETGDPRSDGQGPGIVGEPLLVLVGIVLIGVATVVSTIVIARATGRT